jgi:endoglycosylceramidase
MVLCFVWTVLAGCSGRVGTAEELTQESDVRGDSSGLLPDIVADNADADVQEERSGRPDVDPSDLSVDDVVDAMAGDLTVDAGDIGQDAFLDMDTPEGMLPLPDVVLVEGQRLFRVLDGRLVTAAGDSLFLRGLNVDNRAKYSPGFMAPISHDEVALLPSQGVNLVRLLTFWNAISPEGPGEYDPVYVENYLELLRTVAAQGLFVVVDMHQDLWGPPFEVHGAPMWACPDELKDGYVKEEPWWANYLSPQVTACFDQFWASEELQQEYARMWAHLAQAVCDVPEVIGFDLMNEPFAGSLMGHKQFEAHALFGLYKRVIQAIEAVCPGRLYFLEHSWTFSVAGYDAMPLEAGLKEALVFSPHYYRPELHEPDGVGYVLTQEKLFVALDTLWKDYLGAGWPIWLGEFGGFADFPGFGTFLAHIHQYFQDRDVHSALYDWGKRDDGFSLVDSGGQVKPVFRPIYFLAFPCVLPGSTSRYEYDVDAGTTTGHLTCTVGSQATWLLPGDVPWTCTVSPADGMDHVVADGPFQRWICVQDGPMEMVCAR